MLPIHITAGLLALMAGAIALYATKGSWLHRRSGIVFVAAMLVMSSLGAIMAILKPDRGTALGGVLVFYIVVTAFLTVRRTVAQARGLLRGLMIAALLLGITEFALGFVARSSQNGRLDGYPAALYFVFGSVAFLCAIGDARMLRAGAIEGAKRLTRHIWRMSFAMFMATASFFLGQAKVFPEPLRHAIGLRAIPVLLVLVVMVYWLVRVRSKRMPVAPDQGRQRGALA